MRKTVVVLFLLFAGLIPLLRYHPGPSSVQAAAPVAAAPPQVSTGPGGDKTVDGPVVDSDYGPYQVRATFSGGRLTDVQMITTPSDRHSQRIAQRAAPTLRQEALQAQSAHLDTVSGATATSEAYAQSLQAAIDAKGN
ncbi:FMN-binding protein [Amycolatopsis taiwanensis]|uniref:FMN-binding domain-containing protein n=1 Tax=Amycolatopsis taiwanensis TaxID=342230 RepID=A0A9W6R0X9_9PSEU|nr:FMN-binding protein [Amycolatopsis taiwanensis]GLY65627.1 hypothetical protein Atai01_22460 [Amycolatopsis taiwanensis]